MFHVVVLMHLLRPGGSMRSLVPVYNFVYEHEHMSIVKSTEHICDFV